MLLRQQVRGESWDMDYQDQLLDAANRHLLEQMLQDYREGKETDKRLAVMLRAYADGLASEGSLV